MLAKRTALFLLLLQIAFSAGERDLSSTGPKIEEEEPLDNLGERISRETRVQLRGLDNLGKRINQEVYRGLKPIRIMQSMINVKFGNGGPTIATFAPSGKQLIVINGEHFVCEGYINQETGSCRGALRKMQLRQENDFCYVASKNVINEWYCIAPTSNFRAISYINGKIICETRDGTPRLLIKRTEFDNMCKNVAYWVTYKHFAMRPLTDIGNEMRCSGRRPQVCSFSESLHNLKSVYVNIMG